MQTLNEKVFKDLKNEAFGLSEKLPELKGAEATSSLLVFSRRKGDATILHVVELPPNVVKKYFNENYGRL